MAPSWIAARPRSEPARSIRVGFVLHALHVAGAEVLAVETIRRLAGQIRPTVFCLDAVGELGRQLQSEGVEIICLNRRPGRDFGLAWRFGRLVRSRRIEILHAHQYTPFFYAALAKLLSGCWPRLILTEHGRHYPDPVKPLRRAVNRLLLVPLADEVNAVCAFSARRLHGVDGFSAGRIEVIENGIDISRYQSRKDRTALRRQLGLPTERRYLVHVARCHPVKDQATLLRAFAEICRARNDIDLLFAGDGPLRPELEIQARDLDIAERVRFLGVRHDVPELLQAADVFALTSVSEAASLTLMEALAAGLPVVVTAVGGNPEIVRDGHEGLLVPRGDAHGVAEAVLKILADPALAARLGQAGAARAGRHYQLDQTVRRYHALYRRLVGRA